MNDDDLRVSLVQTRTWWHDADRNLQQFEALIAPLRGQTDVVVLTETFTSGFTQTPQDIAQTMDGPAVAWMLEKAAAIGAAITGSMAVDVGGRYVNRLLWVAPDGTIAHYDKRHLFGYGGEHERYSAGDTRVVITFGAWRICPMICYDLRFPVWTRSDDDFDLQLYVANWPQPRANAWALLLRARAIENQAYVVGVNRVGEDGNGISHGGGSAAVDYLGRDLADLGAEDTVETVVLSRDELAAFRRKLAFLADRDSFVIPNGQRAVLAGGHPVR